MFVMGQELKPLVVAVMGKEIFSQSHIAGSIGTSVHEGVQSVSVQLKDKDAPIILYGLEYADQNPKRLSDALSQAGYTNVRICDEGLRGVLKLPSLVLFGLMGKLVQPG